ncbi:uncharacterized [Tachysurus ichikawai]
MFYTLLHPPLHDFHKCVYAWSLFRAACGPLVKEKHRRKPHDITIECEPGLCGLMELGTRRVSHGEDPDLSPSFSRES